MFAPIFVVGIPRSGTTLVEQIIAAHPKVASCGELQLLPHLLKGHPLAKEHRFLSSPNVKVVGDAYCERVKAIAGGRSRAVDKLPANLFNGGAIWRSMPNARVIIVQRDPMAVGWSCFQTLFGPALKFSYNLRSIGKFINLSNELAEYWMRTFSGRVLTVSYEDLVESPGPQMRKLIDFCSLDWHQNCENFYLGQQKISTASLNQANRPIYKEALERWRKYEDYLSPLASELSLRNPSLN